MTPKPTFLPSDIRSAYQLRYHFGWCTKGRKPILSTSAIRSKVEVTIREVAEKSNYHVLGLDVDSNVLRALISLRPIDSPESVTKKGQRKCRYGTSLRWDSKHLVSRLVCSKQRKRVRRSHPKLCREPVRSSSSRTINKPIDHDELSVSQPRQR